MSLVADHPVVRYATPMRRTKSFLRVANAILTDPGARRWGYELGRQAHVRSGRLYPMLTKMLDRGWLVDGWEEPHEHRPERRPARRYYRLTVKGHRALLERVNGAGTSAAA